MSKRVKVNDDINFAELDNEDLAEHIHWEHSCHLSAKNNQKNDDHVGEARVNLGLDHDWSKTAFTGQRSDDDDIMPPEEYTCYFNRYHGNRSART